MEECGMCGWRHAPDCDRLAELFNNPPKAGGKPERSLADLEGTYFLPGVELTGRYRIVPLGMNPPSVDDKVEVRLHVYLPAIGGKLVQPLEFGPRLKMLGIALHNWRQVDDEDGSLVCAYVERAGETWLEAVRYAIRSATDDFSNLCGALYSRDHVLKHSEGAEYFIASSVGRRILKGGRNG